MASSINASTTAGLVNTADTSGVLNIQTAGTTAISIDASQAVSFTNAPTVTGGTANGVAYLNGSKVLTTGSALVFDGTNLGIGATSISANLQIQRAVPSFWMAETTSGTLQRVECSVSSVGVFNQNLNWNAGSASRAFTWSQGGTENMRIDSSGNLLVGTTSTAQSSGVGLKFLPGGAVYVVSSGSLDGFSLYNTAVGAYRFYVQPSGTIAATNTTIAAISDQRLKENVQDIDAGLDKIMALKPRKFDWKAGKGKDIKGDRGWIAQEFEQVFPDMIDTWKDESPEGEEPYKSVRADLIPVLVKAIQEQQALITQLQADVAALKGA